MGWEAVTSVATILLVMATVALAFVTAYYNRKILAEAQAMRRAEFKPIIYVSDWIESDDPGPGNQWVEFYLKNIGRGPAFAIAVRIDGIKPGTINKGVTAVNPDKSLPTCLPADEKSPRFHIPYGEEDIAAQKFAAPNLVVMYCDIAGHTIESRWGLIQKELRLSPADQPFYLVKSTAKFVVRDL